MKKHWYYRKLDKMEEAHLEKVKAQMQKKNRIKALVRHRGSSGRQDI